MPKQITETKELFLILKSSDAKRVTMTYEKKTDTYKFKVRMPKRLCTYKVQGHQKAMRIKQSLPPGLQLAEPMKK